MESTELADQERILLIIGKKSKKHSSDDAEVVATMPTKNPSSSSSSSDSLSPLSASNSRLQRNLAEKHRRDKLNSYISELASLVPLVRRSNKKLDKTSILRLSAAHLRLHNSQLNPKKFKKFSWKPEELDSFHVSELFKAIDGFLLVTTPTGKIIFSSKSSENYLGHQDIEMIGHSLFSFIHPADLDRVKEELKNLLTRVTNNSYSQRCTFCARMRERSQPRSEVLTYQIMHFSCILTLEEGALQEAQQCITTFRPKRSSGGGTAHSGLLKIFLKPVNINPVDELTITEAFQEEYITKHGVDGKIIFADHRISTITGHLPHEVVGMLAYDYILPQDVPVAHFAQKLMFSSSNGIGMIVYRLRARDSTSVFLKTIGHLQYEKSSTKVSHFVCINKLLTEEEGEEELRKFTDRYSPHIKELLSRHKSLSEQGYSDQDSPSLPSLPPVDSLSLPRLPFPAESSLPSFSQVSVYKSYEDSSDGSDMCKSSITLQGTGANSPIDSASFSNTILVDKLCSGRSHQHITCQACTNVSSDCMLHQGSEHLSWSHKGKERKLHAQSMNSPFLLQVNGRKRTLDSGDGKIFMQNFTAEAKRPCFNMTSVKVEPVQSDEFKPSCYGSFELSDAHQHGISRCNEISNGSPVISSQHGASHQVDDIATETASSTRYEQPIASCTCTSRQACLACKSPDAYLSPNNVASDDSHISGISRFDELCNGDESDWLLNEYDS